MRRPRAIDDSPGGMRLGTNRNPSPALQRMPSLEPGLQSMINGEKAADLLATPNKVEGAPADSALASRAARASREGTGTGRMSVRMSSRHTTNVEKVIMQLESTRAMETDAVQFLNEVTYGYGGGPKLESHEEMSARASRRSTRGDVCPPPSRSL